MIMSVASLLQGGGRVLVFLSCRSALLGCVGRGFGTLYALRSVPSLSAYSVRVGIVGSRASACPELGSAEGCRLSSQESCPGRRPRCCRRAAPGPRRWRERSVALYSSAMSCMVEPCRYALCGRTASLPLYSSAMSCMVEPLNRTVLSLATGADVLEAQHGIETDTMRRLAVCRTRLGRRHTEPRVEARQEVAEHLIGLFDGGGSGEPHLRDQPIPPLKGAPDPFYPGPSPAGCGPTRG